MWIKYGLKAQKLLAHGNALGINEIHSCALNQRSLARSEKYSNFNL